MNNLFANKLINEREVKNGKVSDIVLTKVRDKRTEFLYSLFVKLVREKYNIIIEKSKTDL